MFLDEYVPYKNYKPYKIKPTCEKDAMLLKIREYCFAIDDLNLKLDLEPNNKKLYDLFKVYNERLKVLVKYLAILISFFFKLIGKGSIFLYLNILIISFPRPFTTIPSISTF